MAELLATIDAAELAEWRAFDLIHPIDHARRAEASAGTTSALIYNSNRGERAEAKSSAEFTVDHGRWLRRAAEADDVDQGQLASTIDNVFAALGGVVDQGTPL